MSIPQKPIDWLAYVRLPKGRGKDKDFAESIGMDPNNFAQYKRRRLRQQPTIEDVPLDTIDLTPTAHGSPQSEPTSEPTSEPGSPTTALQRVEYIGSPDGSPGLPDIARQSDMDALKSRVEVLEAFIAIWQQSQPTSHGSPNGLPTVHPVHPSGSPGSPTHKRGFVMADDLFEAIHTYAVAHHLQVKDVVDLALRRFFAQVGQEVRGHD